MHCPPKKSMNHKMRRLIFCDQILITWVKWGRQCTLQNTGKYRWYKIPVYKILVLQNTNNRSKVAAEEAAETIRHLSSSSFTNRSFIKSTFLDLGKPALNSRRWCQTWIYVERHVWPFQFLKPPIFEEEEEEESDTGWWVGFTRISDNLSASLAPVPRDSMLTDPNVNPVNHTTPLHPLSELQNVKKIAQSKDLTWRKAHKLRQIYHLDKTD